MPPLLLSLLLLSAPPLAAAPAPARPADGPWKVPILVIVYLPVTPDGRNVDLQVTSNVGDPVDAVRQKCRALTGETIAALEEGSRFRAYRNPGARPSLDFKVVDRQEVLEAVPRSDKQTGDTWKAHYRRIMERANVGEYVEKRGVKEVWLFGYHSHEISPWESNLSGPFGDISNSDGDTEDLPVFRTSYTVYHYNYAMPAANAVHNHIHQMEYLLDRVDRRMWDLFKGRPGAWRCGNCHFPPNGREDYDYGNKGVVQSDIEDWRPEGFGQKKPLNCDRWGGDELRWFVYWMQSIPGAGSGLTYRGRPLTNWWRLIGDFDGVMGERSGLVAGDPAAAPETSDPGGDPTPPGEAPAAEAEIAAALLQGREAFQKQDTAAVLQALLPVENAAPGTKEDEEIRRILHKVRVRASEAYGRARALIAEGKREEAIAAYDECARNFPGTPQAAKSAEVRDRMKAAAGK